MANGTPNGSAPGVGEQVQSREALDRLGAPRSASGVHRVARAIPPASPMSRPRPTRGSMAGRPGLGCSVPCSRLPSTEILWSAYSTCPTAHAIALQKPIAHGRLTRTVLLGPVAPRAKELREGTGRGVPPGGVVTCDQIVRLAATKGGSEVDNGVFADRLAQQPLEASGRTAILKAGSCLW
jgi:hypothetical protein